MTDSLGSEGSLVYRGYKISAVTGAPVWEKNPVSGHEYVVSHRRGRGFRFERVQDQLPPVLHVGLWPSSVKEAKAAIDFLLKFGAGSVPGEVCLS